MNFLDRVPDGVTLWVDKGYQGMHKYIRNHVTVMMPKKKPPQQDLSADEKLSNVLISGLRMVVEHSINGIKRLRYMTDTYRNRKGQDDQMILLGTALWHFHLQFSS